MCMNLLFYFLNECSRENLFAITVGLHHEIIYLIYGDNKLVISELYG